MPGPRDPTWSDCSQQLGNAPEFGFSRGCWGSESPEREGGTTTISQGGIYVCVCVCVCVCACVCISVCSTAGQHFCQTNQTKTKIRQLKAK